MFNMLKLLPFLPCIMFLFSCSVIKNPDDVLTGKVICIDPGHGNTAATDTFRVGVTGEREEWINLRVALMLRDMLEAKGANVLMTRTEDKDIDLKARANIAIENKADVFISIHHNATADRKVNNPIVYFHGAASENKAGVALAKILAGNLERMLFLNKVNADIISDEVIFPGTGTAVLRHTYGIPGIIGEASYFSNPEEESRLKNPKYNIIEAKAYYQTLVTFFSNQEKLPILKKFSTVQIPALEVKQEAERMEEGAKHWRENYVQGKTLMRKDDSQSIQEAYNLLTLSATSFPDSPVARECHLLRSTILRRFGKVKEAEQEKLRAEEFFILRK